MVKETFFLFKLGWVEDFKGRLAGDFGRREGELEDLVYDFLRTR